jgi:hypothetical protein
LDEKGIETKKFKRSFTIGVQSKRVDVREIASLDGNNLVVFYYQCIWSLRWLIRVQLQKHSE